MQGIRAETLICTWLPNARHALAISRLLEGGADSNVPNFTGRTPFYAAVVGDRVGVAEQLLLAGANANMLFPALGHNIYVLFEAANNNSLEMVNLLLRHGAGVAWADNEGRTILHCVKVYGYFSTEGPIGMVRSPRMGCRRADHR